MAQRSCYWRGSLLYNLKVQAWGFEEAELLGELEDQLKELLTWQRLESEPDTRRSQARGIG